MLVTEHQRKLDKALSELSTNGISSPHYNLIFPVDRLLKLAGVNVRPPYYADFLTNTVMSSIGFGAPLMAVMWIGNYFRDKLHRFDIVESSLFALFAGVLIAIYYLYKKNIHGLSDWKDL